MNTGMLITSLYKNMNPKITIIKDWVYINGIKSKKKYMESWYHSREIFYNDEFVVKLSPDNGLSGTDQNLQERGIWKTISKDRFYSQYFAPSIYCHNKGLFLVQKRLYFTSHKRTETVRNLVENLSKKFNLEDIDSTSNKNWAMIGFCHPVIFDYGI